MLCPRESSELVFDEFTDCGLKVVFFDADFRQPLSEHRSFFGKREFLVDNDEALRPKHTEAPLKVTLLISNGDAGVCG
jgi:hypothetical protein